MQESQLYQSKTLIASQKKNKSNNGIIVLSIVHFILVIVYCYQQYEIVKTSFLTDDPIVQKILVDSMTYISVFLTTVMVIVNICTGIGLIRGKSWSWWLSGIYFLSIIPQKIISSIYFIFLGIQVSRDFEQDYGFPYIENIYNNLYLSIIASLIIVYLFHDHIYCRFCINKNSKKRSFLMLLGLGVIIIIFRIVLDMIGNIL